MSVCVQSGHVERGGWELKSCEISWEDLYTWTHFSSMLSSTYRGIAVHSLWTPEGRARSGGGERGETEQLLSGVQGATEGLPHVLCRFSPCAPLVPSPNSGSTLSRTMRAPWGRWGAPEGTGSKAHVPLTHSSPCPSSVMPAQAYLSHEALRMTPPQNVSL